MIPNCKQESNSNSNNKIFYWDGKSSTSNSSNLELWKSIIEFAKSGTALVISTSYATKTVFIIEPPFAISSTVNINSSLGTGIKTSAQALGTVGYYQYRGSVTLKFTGNELNSVSAISKDSNAEAYSYLSTSTTFTNPFTPTNDSHPATKKYVDDNTIKARLDGATLYLTNDGTNP